VEIDPRPPVEIAWNIGQNFISLIRFAIGTPVSEKDVVVRWHIPRFAFAAISPRGSAAVAGRFTDGPLTIESRIEVGVKTMGLEG
jgi:hypothetical protein